MHTRRPQHSMARLGGFTFIEILASMLFVAIVLPAAVQGILIANRAGVAAERKRQAGRLADSLLQKTMITEQWQDGDSSGDFGEQWPGYRWRISIQTWSEEEMDQVTAQVFYTVQDQEYSITLSTLVDPLSSDESTQEE